MFDVLMKVAKTAQNERSKRLENGWSEESLNSYMAGFENALMDTWLQLFDDKLITVEQHDELLRVLEGET